MFIPTILIMNDANLMLIMTLLNIEGEKSNILKFVHSNKKWKFFKYFNLLSLFLHKKQLKNPPFLIITYYIDYLINIVHLFHI